MNSGLTLLLALLVIFLGLLSTNVVRVFISSSQIPSERREAWKSKGNFFLFGEKPIFYIDTQVGLETIVLLHGYPSSSHDFHKILPRISAKYRVITLDFLGYGFSDKPSPYDYTVQEQASIVESLMHRSSVSHIHIVAHDYGVTVAQELLARFNEKSTDLVILSTFLLNGGMFPESHRPILVQRLLLNPFVGPIVSYFTNFYVFKLSTLKSFGSYQPTNEELLDIYTSLTISGGKENLHLLQRYILERIEHRNRWVSALVESKKPILFLCGPSDPISGRHMGEKFHELVPNQELIYLEEGVGHWPQIEAPDQVFEEFKRFQQRVALLALHQ
jgi:pimeloyl-ACP methyl ester carboxylesterase